MIDFSDIDDVRRTVEHCNRIDVHARHPYGGDLVYTRSPAPTRMRSRRDSRTTTRRRDAAGLDPAQAPLDLPYLPIDPRDVGRDYER